MSLNFILKRIYNGSIYLNVYIHIIHIRKEIHLKVYTNTLFNSLNFISVISLKSFFCIAFARPANSKHMCKKLSASPLPASRFSMHTYIDTSIYLDYLGIYVYGMAIVIIFTSSIRFVFGWNKNHGINSLIYYCSSLTHSHTVMILRDLPAWNFL